MEKQECDWILEMCFEIVCKLGIEILIYSVGHLATAESRLRTQSIKLAQNCIEGKL